MSQELVHITVGYPRTPFMDLLADSSSWNGCRFVALPEHWGWVPFSMFGKETLVKSYLETGGVDMDSVVLFTDAYDILIAEHSSVMLEKFYATGADIVFCAETSFYPTTPDGREPSKARFDAYESKWRYLNGGGYIGYAWAVKLMVDHVSNWVASKDYDPSWESNDQPFLQEFFLANRASKTCRVVLDTGPDIFCCLASHAEEFVVSRSRVRGWRSGKSISVLHANGNKENMSILSRYWALCGGAAGNARLHDLRIATIDGVPLAYDAEKRKLVPSNVRDPAIVVFLVKGDRHAVALSAAHGLLTFNSNGALDTGATRINTWEVLSTREVLTSFHGTTLESFSAASESQRVTVVPLPLYFLAQTSFDNLLALIAQYDNRL